MKKRILSILTALVLCLTLLPTAALAADPESAGTEADPIVLTKTDVTANSTLVLEDGKYYKLGEDISIPNPESYQFETWAIKIYGNVTLNLNGYMLKGPGANSSSNLNGAINIAQDATLTLEDNYDNDRTDVTRYFDVDGTKGYWTLKDSNRSENSVTGGIITGFYANTGVLYNGGTFNMNGGTIVGCSAEDGIVYNGRNSAFNMNGGSVVGCAVYDYGAVHNWAGTFTMDGGSIKNCRAWSTGSDGGGVYNNEGATFNLVNGTITLCKADKGSGVYLKAGGTFNLGGKNNTPGVINITGNTNEDIHLSYDVNKGGYALIHITDAGMANTDDAINVNTTSALQTPATVIDGLNETSKNYFQCVRTGYSFLYGDDGTEKIGKNYCVTFDTNSNVVLAEDDAVKATNDSYNLESLPTVSRTGYNFDGWYTAATGGEKITTATVFTAHTTVYAHWSEAPSYNISTPVVSGGSVSFDKTTAKAGETVTVTVDPDAHYHMDSISVTYANEGNSTPVSVSQVEGQANKYAFTMPTGDVAIVVTFARNSYTITFNANGGSALSPASGGTNADGKLDTLPTPTRSGSYSFAGWFTEATGGIQVTADTVFNENATVYAHWTYTDSSGGGGGSYTPTYTVTAPTNTKNGSISVDTKNAKPGDTVTITLTPDAGYTVETITVLDKNGKEIEVTGLGNGKYSFKMPAGKVEIKATFAEDNTMLNFFTDVSADKYYYDAVLWAARKGITSGIGNNLFAHDASCTRAQIATFLWRAAGSPEPKVESSFPDVSADAYYAKAVAWAVENGITGGIGNNQFAPDLTCTRAQAVAFLFRYEAANGMDFVTLQELVGGYGDAAQVPGYALSAFNWALPKGIVQGYNGNLMPNNNCTRAQIVTMLYRLLGE